MLRIQPANNTAPNSPDEFRVVKKAPLVVPPDYSLRPPNAGQALPAEVDSDRIASVSAFGCSEFDALSSRFSLPSVAIGTVLSTWAEGLDRLIALSAPPPPRLCARLQTRRRERAGTDRPQGKDGAGQGAVCFFLPTIENVSASWGLWRESSIDDTEVWARGPSEEVTVFVL